jgi:hypothetical protein
MGRWCAAEWDGWWEDASVGLEGPGGVGGFCGVGFLVEVSLDLMGSGEGVAGGVVRGREFVGFKVGEAGAEDWLQAGSGVGAGWFEVGETGGVVDEVDQ